MSDTREQSLRVDRWLWYARFFKTRSQAAAAVSGGHVKVNGDRAKPGTRVAPGDRLLILRNRMLHDIVVRTLPQRRGPAAEAQLSFSEDESSVQSRAAALERIRQDRLQMPRTEGRPDKRTRRKVRQFNRQAGDN
jgi:ribosome-associated heat shock protein Hsp15